MKLKILDLETARRTILRRAAIHTVEFPERILRSTEDIFGKGVTPPQAVAEIIRTVQHEGDKALHRWSNLLDQVAVDSFRIPADQLEASFHAMPEELRHALQLAAERIRAFHLLQPLPSWSTTELGGFLGQKITAIERVGIYVPGGSAPLPSSLLMSAIPARVAGVKHIAICTPPKPHPAILAAAHLCEIECVYQIGGAQAIAALAFGTESIPKVDKIVGAGNIFVALAKQQVYGVVGIEGLAGPTETMIIADGTTNPEWIAADLLAQAEHDAMASAILLTPDRSLANKVAEYVAVKAASLPRSHLIKESLAARSGAVIVPDLDTAIEVANDYAPEHLCLSVAEAQALAEKVKNAGGVFLGEHSFEVLGDYVAGPSHVMPTGGTARFASPLNVLDFVKITSVIALDRSTSSALSKAAAELAHAESLQAHAGAAEIRMEKENV